jgi:Zn-dependent M28 family amino/carboxypeptidase
LKRYGWEVEIQESVKMGHSIRNVVGRRGEGGQTWKILGAHYDTRLIADHDSDPEKRSQPVPGGNDGASGVAVLLELARTLPTRMDQEIWLVFFDAEDNGDISGWDWILGSQAFVEQLEGKPDAAVIVDMIGDADLNIHLERNSDPALSAAIWAQAASLGYSRQFIPTPKYSMLDDHTPFLRAEIPAVDIIDFDYPYWHTTGDTADKVSARSLQIVGETVHAWLVNRTFKPANR